MKLHQAGIVQEHWLVDNTTAGMNEALVNRSWENMCNQGGRIDLLRGVRLIAEPLQCPSRVLTHQFAIELQLRR